MTETEIEAIFCWNMARRDADAARYGEPRNAHEFYRGRRLMSKFKSGLEVQIAALTDANNARLTSLVADINRFRESHDKLLTAAKAIEHLFDDFLVCLDDRDVALFRAFLAAIAHAEALP